MTDSGYIKSYAGLDVSTTGSDATVCIAVQTETFMGGKTVYKVKGMYRRVRETMTTNVSKIIEMCNDIGVSLLNVEANGAGDLYIESLNLNPFKHFRIKRFNTNQTTKELLIQRMIQLLEDGDLLIPSGTEIADELLTFKRKGKGYSAPSGKHDDTVMALGLAIQCCPQTQAVFAESLVSEERLKMRDRPFDQYRHFSEVMGGRASRSDIRNLWS